GAVASGQSVGQTTEPLRDAADARSPTPRSGRGMAPAARAGSQNKPSIPPRPIATTRRPVTAQKAQFSAAPPSMAVDRSTTQIGGSGAVTADSLGGAARSSAWPRGGQADGSLAALT